MSTKMIAAILVVGIVALALFAWTRNTAHTPSEAPQASNEAGQGAPGDAGTGGMPGGTPGGASGGAPGGMTMAPQSGGDPGIAWTVPKRWSTEAGNSMRLATYSVPASSGEGGRCAVFYFGPGQGGDTESNITRWIDEFQDAKSPERSMRTVSGLKVSRLRVSGTHMAHASMGGPSEGQQQNYELLAAIVEAPSGSVFFKLTGPVKVVDGAVKEFDDMMSSLKKK